MISIRKELFDKAIEYIKLRQRNVTKKMPQLVAVNPTSEIIAVLEMIKEGDFEQFYDNYKKELDWLNNQQLTINN